MQEDRILRPSKRPLNGDRFGNGTAIHGHIDLVAMDLKASEQECRVHSIRDPFVLPNRAGDLAPKFGRDKPRNGFPATGNAHRLSSLNACRQLTEMRSRICEGHVVHSCLVF